MATPDPIHPGEHLAEMLDELGVTQYRLAKTIGVPQIRVQQIVRGRRAVTPDSALRLGRALGMTPDFWKRDTTFCASLPRSRIGKNCQTLRMKRKTFAGCFLT